MRGNFNIIDPFAGGLNLRDNPLEMEMHYSPDLLNVEYGDGVLRKRHGSESFCRTFTGAGTNDIVSLYPSLVTNMIAVTANGKFYFITTAGVSTDITGAFAPGANKRWLIEEGATSGGQGPLYMIPCDAGVTTPQQWTGTGNIAAWTASAGTLPEADALLYFKNRMFMVGRNVGTGTGGGSGIAASKVGDPRNWDTTASGSDASWLTMLDPNDGQFFNALGTVGPYLIAFKDWKTYLVYDLNTGANRMISDSIGCSSPEAVCHTPFGLAFISSDGGLYITDGSKFTRLSDIVENYYGTNEDSSGYVGGSLGSYFGYPNYGVAANWTPNPCASVHMTYYDNRLYINTGLYTSGTTGNSFVYDLQQKTWWRHSISSHKIVVWSGQALAGLSPLYSAVRVSTATGQPGLPVVERLFSFASDGNWTDHGAVAGGANYNAYHTTIPVNPIMIRRKVYNDLTVRRRFHALRTFLAGTVNLQTSTAINTAPTTIASYSAASSNGLAVQTQYSLGVSRMLIMRWSQTGSANGFAIAPFTLYTQNRAD